MDAFRLPDLHDAEETFRRVGRTLRGFAQQKTACRTPCHKPMAADPRFAAMSFGKIWRWSKGIFKSKQQEGLNEDRFQKAAKSLSEKDVENLLFLGDLKRMDEVMRRRREERKESEDDSDSEEESDIDLIQELKDSKSKEKDFMKALGVDTMEDISQKYDYMKLMDILPAYYFRKDAPKQQHSRQVEAEMGLTRIAQGVCDKGLWGGQQYAFGVFAREDVLGSIMRPWRHLNPIEVVKNPYLLPQLYRFCSELELTVMVVPFKKLSIHKLQWEYAQRLKSCVDTTDPPTVVRSQIDDFVSLFNPERIGRARFVDGTRILPDTQLIFSTMADSTMSIEAINPGPLKDQRTTFLGTVEEPCVSFALFDLFLGHRPIDREAKLQFAKKALKLGRRLDERDYGVLERFDETEEQREKRLEEGERKMKRAEVLIGKKIAEPNTKQTVPV